MCVCSLLFLDVIVERKSTYGNSDWSVGCSALLDFDRDRQQQQQPSVAAAGQVVAVVVVAERRRRRAPEMT